MTRSARPLARFPSIPTSISSDDRRRNCSRRSSPASRRRRRGERHYRGADPATFALHDAQLVLARAYGFDSWPKLKAHVDGVTVARLADAVRAGDVAGSDAMLKRPT